MRPNSDKARYLFVITIVALILGALVGAKFGTATESLGDISKLVIQALKAVAVPLLFLAIADAFSKAHVSSRGFGIMALVSLINAGGAITIGLLIVNFFQPGKHLTFLKDSLATAAVAGTPPKMDWHKAVASLVPDSFVEPFLSGSTPAIILMALALGLALRRINLKGDTEEGSGAKQIQTIIGTSLAILTTIIGWVVYFVPLAVFCAVAKAVGKSGLAIAGGLGIFVVVCVGGMVLHVLMIYQTWIFIHPKLTLRKFWNAAKYPAAYAFGINSSLATMPMTLTALKQTEVRDEAARLSACVGTNFNNDGILLYEVLATLILAQAFGQNLTISHQLYIAVVSVVATLGVAGFPEAGVVALTLVLSAIQLPPEAIVLLMSVDWIIARSRSATNVLGDMAVAVAIDRFLPNHDVRLQANAAIKS